MAAALPRTIDLDVSALAPDVLTVDALARLELAARRVDRRIQLRGTSDDLLDLITFCGLSEALGVESRGEAEERKQVLGGEEEGELDDPAA